MSQPIRLVLALVVVGILALDFAALDDITTGSQPSFILEWTWLAVSTVLLGLLVWALVSLRPRPRA